MGLLVVAAMLWTSLASYLYETYPDMAPTLDCVIQHESNWEPWVVGAGIYVGLAQFDYPTWMATPQGQAGLSRYDGIASIDALAWGWVNLGPGRWPRSSRICLWGR